MTSHERHFSTCVRGLRAFSLCVAVGAFVWVLPMNLGKQDSHYVMLLPSDISEIELFTHNGTYNFWHHCIHNDYIDILESYIAFPLSPPRKRRLHEICEYFYIVLNIMCTQWRECQRGLSTFLFYVVTTHYCGAHRILLSLCASRFGRPCSDSLPSYG